MMTTLLFSNGAVAADFPLVSKTAKACIVYDGKGPKLDSIAAYLLRQDIKQVTGQTPDVYTDVSKAKGNAIIIGNIGSALVRGILGSKNNLYANLNGKWERYGLQTTVNPNTTIKQALVIAGSDARGTAYGVFSISKLIGVSPWYWWADVTPDVKPVLSIKVDNYISSAPSVKYRGIFINDEDWGLQPWAAKTFEPETGDIGPKTYAKIFELLLRLNANLIWPAMHPSTKAFYSYPGNKKVAADYQIVVGSSHAEPMLRNNVSEWDEKTMGRFNYITNKDKVYSYWESRVKESSMNNAIYSMGMRGVHDSGMEGVKGPKEAVPLLEGIFTDQRGLLKKYVNPDVTKIPQVFTAYKEVLDVYDNDLKVPADVTLVWPDDNYGYIQRLSNREEQGREGGSGVYYHASYWGRPHDYLWLSTTHPALMREEMTKAYDMGARNLWVINVGDIKPAEYNIQLFMDMAYGIDPFKNSSYTSVHLQNWLAGIFGAKQSTALKDVMLKYYDLAFERKPEFMGWSQTEPTTQVKFTAYNHTSYGDQAQQRIDAYTRLQQASGDIKKLITTNRKDAFFELVDYPVNGAALINKKFLYRDKAYLYAEQGRVSAQYYAGATQKAYQDIAGLTDHYNQKLAGGKWNNVMSMKPRGLPVYQELVVDATKVDKKVSLAIAPEGYSNVDLAKTNTKDGFKLPVFNRKANQNYFIDVYLTKPVAASYTVKPSASWIKVDKLQGQLTPAGAKSESRLWVSIDWAKIPATAKSEGVVTITAGSEKYQVSISADNKVEPASKGFYEKDGYISIYASSFNNKKDAGANHWQVINKLGTTGLSIEALPLAADAPQNIADTTNIRKNASVSYDFETRTAADAEVSVYSIPTFPLNKNFEMRYAVSVDGGPITQVNFKTAGRSEEWKQNVLSNNASRTIKVPGLKAGKHRLTIYMIDPGVIIDHMLINMGKLKPFYGTLPETKN